MKIEKLNDDQITAIANRSYAAFMARRRGVPAVATVAACIDTPGGIRVELRDENGTLVYAVVVNLKPRNKLTLQPTEFHGA